MPSVHALIEELAIPHRAGRAWWALLATGPDAALPAVRAALQSPNADIRLHCCRLLDHFFVPEALGDLLALADDPDARVRAHALHAMVCDRCKTGSCLPNEAQTLARAFDLVEHDADPFVRAMALEVLGKAAGHDPRAVAALERVIAADPSPAVRKKARWFVPGGPVYERTLRERARKQRRERAA